MKILQILILLCFLACQTTSLYKANSNLLTHWSQEAQKKEPHKIPYLARYKKDHKTLSYIAADHDVSIKSETFRLIKYEFENMKPHLVIIEGYPSERGYSNERLVKWVKSRVKGDMYYGENLYLAVLAYDNKVPFIGGEPSDIWLNEKVIGKGFSSKDMLYFYIARQVPQIRRQKMNEKEGMKYLFGKYLKSVKADLKNTEEIIASRKDFIKWYKEKNKKAFSYKRLTTNDVAPIKGEKATYLQKINYYINHFRNVHIVNLISDMLNKYDKVLIAYGAGHLVQQKHVLEDMLGVPYKYYKISEKE